MPSTANRRLSRPTTRNRRSTPPSDAAGPRLVSIARCDGEGRIWLAGQAEPSLVLAGVGALSAGMQVLALPVGAALVIVGRVLERQAIGEAGKLELSAEREVVLRCGAASLTLTQAGKAILAGEYVLSRARGVNKIKGGSVQIN